jgi:threonine aldolase
MSSSHYPNNSPRALDFRSDNVAGMPAEVLEALARAAAGSDSAYGEDGWTQRLQAKLTDLFEHEVSVFVVATGTAANALALSTLVPPWGAIFCHEEAHIATDECGAPEFLTGGAKLIALPGPHAKLDPTIIENRLSRSSRGVHHVQPAAVSLSQSTEAGTVYAVSEVGAIGETCRRHGLRLHMDGARFANAIAHLGCAPSETTWRAGVDALSFGLTKNGAAAAEAVIFFDRALAEGFAYRRKRAGHLFSKMRFVSAQFEALLSNGLWLRLAAQANATATRLAKGLARERGVRLLHPVEANELFVLVPEMRIAALERAGFLFYRWDCDEGPCIRLVTAFDTEPAHIDGLLAALGSL